MTSSVVNTVECVTDTEPKRVSLRTNQSNFQYRIRVEDFIWLELSLVKEVEYVFVEKNEAEKLYSVLTVVNERSPEIRSKIYQREKSIFAAYPHLYFDFHILPRMGRELNKVVSTNERPYTRMGIK